MNHMQLSSRVWTDPVYFIAFGFGSGLMAFAPGTWGTLAGMLVYLLIQGLSWQGYLLACSVFLGLGVWVSGKVGRDLGVEDYKGIVWDEVVGYLLTLFLVPLSLKWMITGFILFRIFDIWKPYPIVLVDKHIPGGLGVMLDDVLAAIPSWLILQGLVWWSTR